MSHLSSFCLGAIASIWLTFWTAPATWAAPAAVGRTIVYLQCAISGTTQEVVGTGVLVSAQGHVLTARHVAPEGSTCQGSIGVATPGALRPLILQPTSPVAVDAALLVFANDGSEVFEFARYCPLDPSLIRRDIYVAGFPGETKTASVSYRKGVLSTVLPRPDGLIETDGQTIAGMSGGPVFSKNLSGLIGIVIGAKLGKDNIVDFYGILPASRVASAFDLTATNAPCYRNRGEVDFKDARSQWNTGDDPLRLGVRADEGTCFLSKVWGRFNDREDTVGIELRDGEYVLTGSTKQPGSEFGAAARCIWYD